MERIQEFKEYRSSSRIPRAAFPEDFFVGHELAQDRSGVIGRARLRSFLKGFARTVTLSWIFGVLHRQVAEPGSSTALAQGHSRSKNASGAILNIGTHAWRDPR
jgi:hypothetical protein